MSIRHKWSVEFRDMDLLLREVQNVGDRFTRRPGRPLTKLNVASGFTRMIRSEPALAVNLTVLKSWTLERGRPLTQHKLLLRGPHIQH